MVEAVFDGAELGIGDGAEVEATRQALSSQTVGVFAATALPGSVGVGEEKSASSATPTRPEDADGCGVRSSRPPLPGRARRG